ncbi:hypothetical protein [Candidatus Uabimicrobium amorphum]|uniref:Uncharacterized protein n=1 Tax=Uabimicrobium amorphum TaxID=2596890 RepID=A0A5S9IP44_UABAM|nr:hypothetical protein [Candidatus Uabimicrobium amorphum]BBM85036.1 hypothetical protein UABAM_03399 [Candidatus Uabimicrobium amorphum]
MVRRRTYKTYDVAARTASLALFAILIGLSIEFGIELILRKSAKFYTYVNFATFLITAARFYHGITIYHEKPRRESPAQFMINFYFHIIILMNFCIIARFISSPRSFVYALLVLSLIDVVWAFLSCALHKFQHVTIFKVWLSLNVGSAVFLFLMLCFSGISYQYISLLIFGFYVVMAALDYYFCRDYYFYEEV